MKQLIFLIYTLAISTTVLGQQEQPLILKDIADTACPCFEQIDYDIDIATIDAKGSDCLIDVIMKYQKELIDEFGQEAMTEEFGYKLGEEVSAILIKSCPSFIKFAIKISGDEMSEGDIASNYTEQQKTALNPIIEEFSDITCQCIEEKKLNAIKNNLDTKEIVTECMAHISLEDKKYQKKFKKILNKKNIEEDYIIIGELIGLKLLENCQEFQNLMMDDIINEKEDEAEVVEETDTDWMNPIAKDACKCFDKIPDNISVDETNKQASNCMDSIMLKHESLMIKKVGNIDINELTEEDGIKITSLLITKLMEQECSSFFKVVQRVRE